MKQLAIRGKRASISTGATKGSNEHDSSSEKEEENDDVGFPPSMVSRKKNERQFSVLRSDESAANPFHQIFEAIKHNRGTKQFIQNELEALRSGVSERVDSLQGDFIEKISSVSERLESVEKYMFRQDVILKMRENQARKKRQERVRSPATGGRQASNGEEQALD